MTQLNEIAELKANINDLRKALLTTQDALSQLAHHGIEQWAKDRADNAYEYIEKTLASTPAQSLIKHNDEVIERCAKVCLNETDADNIRALKGKL